MTGDAAQVGVIMGSRSDWPTMRHAVEVLEELGYDGTDRQRLREKGVIPTPRS